MITWHGDLDELLVPINTVSQHPDNPNNGDIESIAESIQVNGCYRAVVAQRSTGHILVGNHQYAALMMLGSQMIPVVWADVDDNQALRIMVADNRLSAIARIDEALLADALTALDGTDLSLAGTGFSPLDYSGLLARLEDPLPIPEDFTKQNAPKGTFECPNCGWRP